MPKIYFNYCACSLALVYRMQVKILVRLCAQVVKTVYASPDRVNFHVDSRKASINSLATLLFSIFFIFLVIHNFTNLVLILLFIQEVETTPAYPDICFAVDDFDSTFDAMVTPLSIIFFCYEFSRNWYLFSGALFAFFLSCDNKLI